MPIESEQICPVRVDFNATVDGYHLVILTDDRYFIHIVDVQKGEERIVMNIVVQFAATQAKSGHHPSGVFCFEFIVDDTRFDQRNDPIGEHFRMNAQITVVAETAQHRVRNGAYAHLQGSAIGDQFGDVFADFRSVAVTRSPNTVSCKGSGA